MTYPVTLSESLAIQSAKVFTADSYGATLTFDKINQSVAHINMGTQGGTTVTLYQSTVTPITDKDAATSKVITGKTLTWADGDDDIPGAINVKAEELDNAGGYKYWTWYADVTSTSTGGITVVGADARYGPASDQNMTDTKVVK